MSCDCERIEININKDFNPYKAGQKITITAKSGIPCQQYWRDRLRDAESDGCVTIIKPVAKKKSTKPEIGKEG